MPHIYSTYTHQDFINGKIFFHNHKLCLDLFHGLRGAELHKHKAETQYQELTEDLDPKEKGQILSQQFTFYHERVASHVSSAKRNFFSRCAPYRDKLQEVIEEIDRFEKILYAEKLPDVKHDQQYDFGRFKLDGSKILSLRSVLNAVSGHKTYDLSGMNSPQCRFHFPTNTNNYIDADHYFKYLVWLRSVKDELEKRKCPVPHQNVMEIFSFFDTYVGINTKSVLISHELKKIMAVETEIEALENGYTNYFEGNHQLSLWAFGFFRKEADKIISQVKTNTIQCDNTEKIKAYVGQVYSFTKGLLEKNKVFVTEDFAFGDEDKMMRIYLDLALNTVKDALERDYDLYLEDSDAKKITIQSFVHCVLHEFEDRNKKLYGKPHKEGCNCFKETHQKLEKYKRKKLREFENRYQTIVLNWIDYNCRMGNCFDEKHFIRFASGLLEKMFKLDKEKNVFYVLDRHHERFEFHPDFYNQQIVPFCDFFKTFFEMRKEEISDLPDEEHDHRDDDRGKLDEIEALNIPTGHTNQAAKTSRGKETHLPIIEAPTLEENKKIASETLLFLSGCNVHKKKIMSQENFNRMMDYVYYLIEHETLPARIKPIPQIDFPTTFLRYTFYLLHKEIYTTSQIRQEWIDFLHKVFRQFENHAPSTTRKKFAEEPKSYYTDLVSLKK